jgi:hypothetical protein
MFRFLQILTVILVAVAMALPLAHALELPGKMRLGKEAYLVVQPIYYPGFTIGAGVGEAGGMFALLVLLAFTPYSSARFGWTLAALLLLLAMHLTYWFATHPANHFWVKDIALRGFAGAFLSLFAPVATESGSDWTRLRDIWEYSHVARAVFAALGLISLMFAVTA